VTDDAELRARIAAEGAARRAGASTSEISQSPAEDVPNEAEDPAGRWANGAEPNGEQRGRRLLDRALRHRGAGRRHDADGPARPHAEPDAASAVHAPDAAAVSGPDTVVVSGPDAAVVSGPDAAVVSAFAEPAAPMLDQTEAPAEAAPAVADEAEAEYPWLRKEAVDLDLHGAPTWDPAMYPAEPDDAETRPARRALRRLLARNPEAEAAEPSTAEPSTAEPAAAEPSTAELPTAEPADPELPAAELPTAEPPAAEPPAAEAPAAEAEPAPETEVGDEVAEPAIAQRSVRRRLFGRRRRATADGDYVPLALPEPDAAFEESWLKVGPPPTVEPEPTQPEPVEAVTVEPEPVEAATVEPDPATDPATARRRPSPGPLSLRRHPTPGPSVARRRPRPTPALAASADREPDVETDVEAQVEADVEADVEAQEKRPGNGPRWRRSLIRTGITLLIVAIAATVLRLFVVQPYYIPSESMEPTLHGCTGCNDDHVLVDKISYRIHAPKQGDIVVFHRPADVSPDVVPEHVLIKRIVAVGGDQIQIKDGQVIVDNRILEEDYVNHDHSCYALLNYAERTIPQGDVFVMGDNRCNSIDSRVFGPVPDSAIIGRAFARIWPMNKIGFFGH
jgi:signal peptidase I